METSNNNTKLLGALLLGSAIGAGLGILFAPRKGSETRRKIMNKGNDLTDSLKDKVDSVKEKANHFMKDGYDKAEKLKTTKSNY